MELKSKKIKVKSKKIPTKWEVDERILRSPYYVVYDRYENHLRAFQLIGTRYKPISLPENHLWLEELELGLGFWQGTYQQITGLFVVALV